MLTSSYVFVATIDDDSLDLLSEHTFMIDLFLLFLVDLGSIKIKVFNLETQSLR